MRGITQQPAGKGQKAREEAEREYEERKAKRGLLEEAGIDTQTAKRASVVRNLDKPEGEGFFASAVAALPSAAPRLRARRHLKAWVRPGCGVGPGVQLRVGRAGVERATLTRRAWAPLRASCAWQLAEFGCHLANRVRVLPQ